MILIIVQVQINQYMKISSIDQVDMAITVKKQSQSGMFKNERLLLIKSGFISYYSTKPSSYVGNVRSIQLSGQLPKMTLSASNIQSINQKGKYLYIDFDKKHLINLSKLSSLINGEINQSQALQGNQQGQIEWSFKCDSIQLAQMFMNQVLICKNNPDMKPRISQVIKGYRQGKKGIRPQSLQYTPSGSAHSFESSSLPFRLSEQSSLFRHKNKVGSESDSHRQSTQLKFLSEGLVIPPVEPQNIIEEENQQENGDKKSEPDKSTQKIDQISKDIAGQNIKQQIKTQQIQNQKHIKLNQLNQNNKQISTLKNKYMKIIDDVFDQDQFAKNTIKQQKQNGEIKQNFLEQQIITNKDFLTKQNNKIQQTQKIIRKKSVNSQNTSALKKDKFKRKSLDEKNIVKQQNSKGKKEGSRNSQNIKNKKQSQNNKKFQTSYGKQTFPYFPFVMSKTKEVQNDLIGQAISQKYVDERLLSKLAIPKSPSRQKMQQIQKQMSEKKTINIDLSKFRKVSSEHKNLQQDQSGDGKQKKMKNNDKKNVWSDFKKRKQEQQRNKILSQQINDKTQQLGNDKIHSIQVGQNGKAKQENEGGNNLLAQQIGQNSVDQLQRQKNDQQRPAQNIDQFQSNEYRNMEMEQNNMIKSTQRKNNQATSETKMNKLESEGVSQNIFILTIQQNKSNQQNTKSQFNLIHQNHQQLQIHNQQYQQLVKLQQIQKVVQNLQTPLQATKQFNNSPTNNIKLQTKPQIHENLSQKQKQKQKQQGFQNIKEGEQQKIEIIQSENNGKEQNNQKQEQIIIKAQKQKQQQDILILDQQEQIQSQKQQLKSKQQNNKDNIQPQIDGPADSDKTGQRLSNKWVQEKQTQQIQKQQIQNTPLSKTKDSSQMLEQDEEISTDKQGREQLMPVIQVQNESRQSENDDAMSFGNLQFIANQPSQCSTPRFWEEQSATKQISPPHNQVTNSKQIIKHDSHSQTQKQPIKPIQTNKSYSKQNNHINKQINQNILSETSNSPKRIQSYATDLLKLVPIQYKQKNNCEPRSVILRKMLMHRKKQKNQQYEQFPNIIAKQLLTIRQLNKIKQTAVKLFLKEINGNPTIQNILDCQSIVFGKRIKVDGWCLYICSRKQDHDQICQFYKIGSQTIQSLNLSSKIRMAKVFSLQYKTYFALFIEHVLSELQCLPIQVESLIKAFVKQQNSYQILKQMKIGMDKQNNRFIIWFNPDYLSDWQSVNAISNQKCEQYQSSQVSQNSMKMQVKQLWAKTLQSTEDQEKGEQIRNQLIKLVNQYAINISVKDSNNARMQMLCKIKEIKGSSPESVIENLHLNAFQNQMSVQQLNKAAKSVYWYGLKVLAEGDLHQAYPPSMLNYLRAFTKTAELYLYEHRFREVSDICNFILQIIFGSSFNKQFLNCPLLSNQSKLLFQLNCGSEECHKNLVIQQIQRTLIFLLISKLNNNRNYQKQRIIKLYLSSIKLIELLSIDQQKYFKLVLHTIFINNPSGDANKAQIEIAKLQAYDCATAILKKYKQISTRNQMYVGSQVIFNAILDYIDLLMSQNKFKDAMTAIKQHMGYSNFKNAQCELNSRMEICQLHLGEFDSTNHQNFFEYLVHYLRLHQQARHQTKQACLLFYGKASEEVHLLAIQNITTIFCEYFAANDYQLCSALIQVLTAFHLSSAQINFILSNGIPKIDPPIWRRIAKKYSL